MYDEDEYLMLSGIQHFVFCRRQWALIHIEQQWAENYRTTAGKLMHEKAHDEESTEKRGNVLIMRGLRVASAVLGISGQCDVVEFHTDKSGITLSRYNGTWKPVPIEYKRGEPKEGREDILQLCAQAICLEEMLLTEISTGYLYYGTTRRRLEVDFSKKLREEVADVCMEMHDLYKRAVTPKVKSTPRCKACSLNELCLPKLNAVQPVHSFLKSAIETKVADKTWEEI